LKVSWQHLLIPSPKSKSRDHTPCRHHWLTVRGATRPRHACEHHLLTHSKEQAKNRAGLAGKHEARPERPPSLLQCRHVIASEGEDRTFTVNSPDFGVKKLVERYARLKLA
jgi:hypothetical protein